MGRTGKMWACEHFDAVPDISTVAKGIASGMPLGAMIARADMMDWPPGAHASTFGGQSGRGRGRAGDHRTAGAELIDNAAGMGDHMMDRMRDWPRRFRNVGDVRGLGLMIGVELVRDQATKERAPELRDRVVDMAFERGLLILGAGPEHDPPLPAADDHARSGRFRRRYTGGMPATATTRAVRILDVGCGINKYPGPSASTAIPHTRADVLCDLDRFPIPFRDGSFDSVRAIHVIEHVADVIRTMEEFHRLLRPAGGFFIATPHYTDFSSFCDPTHRWHLNSFSFRYFGEDHVGFGYYSKRRFREISVRVKLLAFWRWLGFEFLVNRFPAFPALLGILLVLCGARAT